MSQASSGDTILLQPEGVRGELGAFATMADDLNTRTLFLEAYLTNADLADSRGYLNGGLREGHEALQAGRRAEAELRDVIRNAQAMVAAFELHDQSFGIGATIADTATITNSCPAENTDGNVVIGGNLPFGQVPPIVVTRELKDSARPHNMQELAFKIAQLSGTGGNGREHTPFQIVQIGPNDWLVLISGTQSKGGADNWGSDVEQGSYASAYQREVLAQIEQNIPHHANIHFAGHSLGGMIANSLADNRAFTTDYNVRTVTTFGTPIDPRPNSQVSYHRYLVEGDIIGRFARAHGILSLSRVGPSVFLGVLEWAHTNNAQTVIKRDPKPDGSMEKPHSSYDQSTDLTFEPLPFSITEYNPMSPFPTNPNVGLSRVANDVEKHDLRQLLQRRALGKVGIALLLDDSVDTVQTMSEAFPKPIRDRIDDYTDRLYGNALKSKPVAVSIVASTFGLQVMSSIPGTLEYGIFNAGQVRRLSWDYNGKPKP